MPETDLYLPVKRFIEGLGFEVKGEVGGCDVLALRDGDPPVLVVCELKQTFKTSNSSCRRWTAPWRWTKSGSQRGSRNAAQDARTMRGSAISAAGWASGCWRRKREPGRDSAQPRRVLTTQGSPASVALVEEHRRRRGDPVAGGGSKQPVMTAYRQGALACAAAMVDGPKRPRDLKPIFEKAPAMLRDNVYQWFTRVDRGLYGLTDAGHAALARWPQAPAHPTAGA